MSCRSGDQLAGAIEISIVPEIPFFGSDRKLNNFDGLFFTGPGEQSLTMPFGGIFGDLWTSFCVNAALPRRLKIMGLVRIVSCLQVNFGPLSLNMKQPEPTPMPMLIWAMSMGNWLGSRPI